MTTDHLIVVEKRSDFRWNAPAARIVTAEEFIAEAVHPRGRPRRVINLCRSFDYLGVGYYCSLLAEARGDRVTPSVEAIQDLLQKTAQLPSLAELNRLVGDLGSLPRALRALTVHVFFGQVEDPGLVALARQCFELLHCPLLEIVLERTQAEWRISAIKPLDPREIDASRDDAFLSALTLFSRRSWRPTVVHRAPRMDLAILHDPTDPLPPSKIETLEKFAEIGRDMDIRVELIGRHDYSRLTQFDALFIRETTAVVHHTFKFAKRAAAEGMPVIDDPAAILRCTNKAFLAEMLREHGVPTPATRLLTRHTLARFEGSLNYPVVLKVPDGAFSLAVKKAEDWGEFCHVARAMLKESDIVLVQDFMYTDFDWRVGVLAGEPLFVARYHMCPGHWQILQHTADGAYVEGLTEAVALRDTPKRVLDTAVAAARLVGDGLYGVDLKQNASGVFVIEINDNPNIDIGAEDAALGDDLYRRILGHLMDRFEGRLSRENELLQFVRPDRACRVATLA